MLILVEQTSTINGFSYAEIAIQVGGSMTCKTKTDHTISCITYS